MLLDIRETVRNSKPLKYSLITIICIPFALVGIGSYLGGSGYTNVAEVDGVEINSEQVDRAYNGLKNQYQQMFGGSIPANLLSDAAIREQALDSLVTDIVVRNTVEDQKFAVGDETLGRAIRNDTRFHTDGKFDPERYQNMVRGSLSSVAAYEESLRGSAAISQFRAGVEATSFQLPSETKRLESLANQTRTIDFVRFSIDKAIENIEVTDEQITTYFDENASNYMFPQRAKVEYIELNKADLAAAIDISEEEVAAHYEQFSSDFVTQQEVRETAHILLEVSDMDDADELGTKTAELEAIKTRIVDGESFADLAKEFSDDLGTAQSGGSRGQVDASYMEAQYVDAANALTEVDELSDIVKSRYGVHLIKLEKYEPAVVTPFEEAKPDIISLLKNNAADSEFVELRTSIEENIASDPESLEYAADAANIVIKKTQDWVDADTQDDPIFSNPQVMGAVFSEEVLENQNNSDLIELGPNQVVALRVLEHEGPRPKALDDVREEITAALKREGAATKLEESAKAAVALMLKGTAVAAVAKDDPNATATANEVLTRQSFVIDAAAVTEIYALAKPAPGKVLVKTVALQNGDRIAYALKAVDTPEPDAETAEEGTTQLINTGLGQAELAAIVETLRENADVTIEQ